MERMTALDIRALNELSLEILKLPYRDDLAEIRKIALDQITFHLKWITTH